MPPKYCPAPKFLVGSIVISFSLCCLPNNEGPAPQYFFLEPPLGGPPPTSPMAAPLAVDLAGYVTNTLSNRPSPPTTPARDNPRR